MRGKSLVDLLVGHIFVEKILNYLKVAIAAVLTKQTQILKYSSLTADNIAVLVLVNFVNVVEVSVYHRRQRLLPTHTPKCIQTFY